MQILQLWMAPIQVYHRPHRLGSAASSRKSAAVARGGRLVELLDGAQATRSTLGTLRAEGQFQEHGVTIKIKVYR